MLKSIALGGRRARFVTGITDCICSIRSALKVSGIIIAARMVS